MVADRNQLGESRDLKEEADSEKYEAMLDTVRAEWTIPGSAIKPDEYCVHCEAMRRLKEKYSQE